MRFIQTDNRITFHCFHYNTLAILMTTYSLTSDTLDNTISLGDHRDFQSRHIHSETTGAYSLDYHTPPSHHYPLCRNYSAACVPSSQHGF